MREELSPAVEAYLRHRRSQDYSKATLRHDQQVLKRFMAINGNIWCHAIKDLHVNRHFEEVSKTRAPSSMRNDHATLHQFFRWCRHTGRMPVDSDPMFGRRQPKVQQRERNRIPVGDFARLLDTAEAKERRDRALVAVLLYTLMRDSEVTSLRVRDVDLGGGWIRATVHKTRDEDMVPISEELDSELRDWLTHYTVMVGPLQPHYFLIPSRTVHPVRGDDGRITHHDSAYKPEKQIRAAGRIVTPLLERFGFPVVDHNGKPLNEGAHTIRRSGARALFDQLVDGGYDHGLRVVQSLLHHKSLTMTERYIGISADRRSRDEILKGRTMYKVERSNVVELVR
jgi:integrase